MLHRGVYLVSITDLTQFICTSIEIIVNLCYKEYKKKLDYFAVWKIVYPCLLKWHAFEDIFIWDHLKFLVKFVLLSPKCSMSCIVQYIVSVCLVFFSFLTTALSSYFRSVMECPSGIFHPSFNSVDGIYLRIFYNPLTQDLFQICHFIEYIFFLYWGINSYQMSQDYN